MRETVSKNKRLSSDGAIDKRKRVMNKKVAASIVLMGVMVYGMEVEIPKREILEERLRKHGLEDFMRMSSMSRFASGKKTPKQVAIDVANLIVDYTDWAQLNPIAFATHVPEEKVERILLQTILQDSPQALQVLEADETLKPCGPINLRPIKLPPADILRTRLSEIGLDHFVNHSGLVDDLANLEKTALGVRIACDRAVERYHSFLHHDNLSVPMLSAYKLQLESKQRWLLETLLCDTPEALKELEALYQESE